MRIRPMLAAAIPSGVVSLLVLVGLGLAASLTGCKPAKIKSTQDNSELGQVVAKVDDNVITVGDVQERINKQAPFIRSRYTTVDKKKEFLDNLIRFEVMAAEAQKRGYDKDPEVVRVMKQQMISKFLQKDFESKLKIEDVPDAEVEKYYNAHPEEFNRKDEVRVSQILVKDKAKAEKVAAEVRALPKATGTPTAPATADQKPFRDLVTKYSEDEDSKQRAGDLTFFDKDSIVYPKPLVEAAFKLVEVGDVAGPIKSDKGYHIIKLTQKKPGFTRPIAEVKRQIQQRLFRDLRTKSMESFIADLRKKSKIDIHEDMLAKVLVDSGINGEGPGGSAMGSMAGMPPGSHPSMPMPAAPGAIHPMGAMSPATLPPPGALPPPGGHAPNALPATAKHP